MTDGSAGGGLFPAAIETERLRLEQLGPGAVDPLAYYEVCSSDPGIDEMTERMPLDPHDHPRESLEVLERVAEKFDDGDAATYAIRPRAGEGGAGDLAGQTTLRIDWERQVGTLGIWLRKRFWGRGYSGERAAALLALAFDRLDLEVVSVTHEPDNERSRRAIEKYVERFGGPVSDANGTSSRAQRSDGGRREGRLRNHLPFDEEPADGVRYTVSREEYREHAPGGLDVSFSRGVEPG